MPIFEYICDDCHHKFERLVLKASEPSPPCPKCHNTSVEKIFSAASVRPHGIPTGSGGFKPPACKANGGCGG